MTATWPVGDRGLERRYRRLLLAYPGPYRRQHGTEIVTTLLDMAAPGQRRPGVGEALHLLGSGLRQRFRLPAGRPLAVIAAVLTALALGAFGAAAGSWAGAQTSADLPDGAGLAQQASGLAGEPRGMRNSTPWTAEAVWTTTEVGGGWDVEQARQRFAAQGWSVSGSTPLEGRTVTTDPDTGAVVDVPMHNSGFRAESNGLVLQVSGFLTVENGITAEHGMVVVDAWAQSTPAFLPLIVLGAVGGLVAGWLLAAASAYRIQRAPTGRRRAAAGLSAMALLALALPVVALYGNVMRAFRHHGDFGPAFTVHSAFTPGPYYPFGPTWQILALSITGLVVAAAATLPARPGGRPQPQEAPVVG